MKSAEVFRLFNRVSSQCLVPWINHLSPGWWFIFRNVISNDSWSVSRVSWREIWVVSLAIIFSRFITIHFPHDDVTKWKHFPRYWPFVRGIHLWRGALMFSLICARMSSWENNHEACDLRRHRAHYGVIAMPLFFSPITSQNKYFYHHIPLTLTISNLHIMYVIRF